MTVRGEPDLHGTFVCTICLKTIPDEIYRGNETLLKGYIVIHQTCNHALQDGLDDIARIAKNGMTNRMILERLDKVKKGIVEW